MAHPRPSVSVALATYNGARFLAEQLTSLAAQSLLPDELVVSDDGSTDETLSIVRAFAETSPFPVRILDKPERLGFSDNFLFAAEQCHGDLVAFCDQDDVWLSDKLQTGVDRLVRDDSLLSMHRLTMTDGALTPTQVWDQGIGGDHAWEPLALNPWSGWGNTMVFRRSLATLVARSDRPRHPEADRALSHDTWLYVLAAALGRVSHIARPLILYRQHGANAFGMVKSGWRERLRLTVTVPVSTYRERDRFYGDLAAVFDTLSDQQSGGMAARAALAAQRYRERQWRAQVRGDLYEGATTASRAAALWNLYVRHGADQPLSARVTSAARDIGLGLTGWGRRA